jgi:hypothetical protein
VPVGDGTAVHHAGWKSPLEAGYLEFLRVQVQVQVRLISDPDWLPSM